MDRIKESGASRRSGEEHNGIEGDGFSDKQLTAETRRTQRKTGKGILAGCKHVRLLQCRAESRNGKEEQALSRSRVRRVRYLDGLSLPQRREERREDWEREKAWGIDTSPLIPLPDRGGEGVQPYFPCSPKGAYAKPR